MTVGSRVLIQGAETVPKTACCQMPLIDLLEEADTGGQKAGRWFPEAGGDGKGAHRNLG